MPESETEAPIPEKTAAERSHTPDAIMGDLAEAHRAEPGLGFAGVHFFAFGGIAGTARRAKEIPGDAEAR